MTVARRQQIVLQETRYYHCVSRCVRRAFLCGFDSYTKQNFDHRKEWLIERFQELTSIFAIRICAYAVMQNHYHLVLYVDVEQAARWTKQEIENRWNLLFKSSNKAATQSKKETQSTATSKIETWRERLTNLSWFMRCLNEQIARRANREDNCKGRFWEGRFKSQALIDEGALLACMAYVDLNPIRAGISETPEESKFTSIFERIKTHKSGNSTPPTEKNNSTLDQEKFQFSNSAKSLMPFRPTFSESNRNKEVSPKYLPIKYENYLELLDWSGRIIRKDKKGAIPNHLLPILDSPPIESW